jgi:uncharacterized oxidoreductase
MPRIAAEGLREFVGSVFRAAGVPAREAAVVTEHLVQANLAGVDSHGVLRVPQYVEALKTGKVKAAAARQVLSETPGTAAIDGGLGFGQVVCNDAMALALDKAGQTGIAAVTVRNCYHCGCVGLYTRQAAAREMIGIVMVNAGGGGQSVAPFGGLARRLATNPLSIGAPSGKEFPIVLDIATSVAPEGKVRDCYQTGKAVPPGWMADAQGQPSTDPKAFYEGGGALLPLGGPAGYKGFGLAFLIDILAGALSGAGCCQAQPADPRDGLLLIALNIERFLPMAAYLRQVTALVEHVKSCPPAPGFGEVFVPGEIEFREEQRRRRDGIEIPAATWRLLEETAAAVGAARR